jgi:hypothetical protein
MSDLMKQHGAFSWCELMTTDVTAAKQFYSQLFGWQMDDQPLPEMGMTYTVVKVGDRGVGGIMPMPPQSSAPFPCWNGYVTVDDVDASVKLAEQLGAKILVSPTDIPDTGRFCVIQDPQGAVINLISYL